MPHVSKKVKALTTRQGEAKLKKELAHLERVYLDLEERRNNLILADEVRDFVLTCNNLVVMRLMALSTKLAPRLVDLTIPDIARVLDEGIREALEELPYAGNNEHPQPNFRSSVDKRIGLVLAELEDSEEEDNE